MRPPEQIIDPSDYGLVTTPSLPLVFPVKQFQWGFKVPPAQASLLKPPKLKSKGLIPITAIFTITKGEKVEKSGKNHP